MKEPVRFHGLIPRWPSFFLLWVVFSCGIVPGYGEAASREEISREGFPEGIEYLLSLSSRGGDGAFDPSLVEPVIAFVAEEKQDRVSFHAGELDGMPSAYHEFPVQRDMVTLLRYAYSPDIPANVFRPSSVRLTRWLEVDGGEHPLPRMWTRLPDPGKPVVVTGVEYEESTPEPATGACYGYTMDRALVLFRSAHGNVFISISKQRGESDKGRKGVCLGEDGNWDYVYTGEEGLTRQGLGWADTHIYDAFSIAVFHESSGPGSGVRCGIFKWIRAGWAGMNLVKNHHIQEGLARFADGFRATMDHARLPDADRLARMFAWIQSLPSETIRVKVNEYFRGLCLQYPDEKVFTQSWFEDLLETGDYAARMTRAQMESLVALEYMKWVLGRNTVLGERFGLAPSPDARLISRTWPP